MRFCWIFTAAWAIPTKAMKVNKNFMILCYFTELWENTEGVEYELIRLKVYVVHEWNFLKTDKISKGIKDL